MTQTALELRGIAKSFGATRALDEVDLSLRPGEVHALVGENGAGKSTLMNILAGALRPDAGSMEIDGKPFAPGGEADARRHGIRFVHQELALCPHLTIAENILLGAEPSRAGFFDRRAAEARARDVLASFEQRELDPARRVASLSVPAQQVVEICRAVASDARVILMDEPTSSLPRADVERLFRVIRRLKSEGRSVIYISHFLEEVREIADRFTVLRDGRSVLAGDLGEVTNEDLIRAMVGRSVEQLFPERSRVLAGEVLLEARDLAAPPALRAASLTLRRGEILGVAGLMGSGRSTLVRTLFGLREKQAGAIMVSARASGTSGATPAARLRQGVGYLSEDRKGEGLALPLSVADNTTLADLSPCAKWGWLSLRRQREQAARLMRELGTRARDAGQPVGTLSGGNQQKIAFARLLHQKADVLLLDEPTRGIDIGSRAQIYETIARCADEGRAVLMVSSYLPELFGMCDRLAVVSRGRLSEARAVGEWTPETVMRAALGEADSGGET